MPENPSHQSLVTPNPQFLIPSYLVTSHQSLIYLTNAINAAISFCFILYDTLLQMRRAEKSMK